MLPEVGGSTLLCKHRLAMEYSRFRRQFFDPHWFSVRTGNVWGEDWLRGKKIYRSIVNSQLAGPRIHIMWSIIFYVTIFLRFFLFPFSSLKKIQTKKYLKNKYHSEIIYIPNNFEKKKSFIYCVTICNALKQLSS